MFRHSQIQAWVGVQQNSIFTQGPLKLKRPSLIYYSKSANYGIRYVVTANVYSIAQWVVYIGQPQFNCRQYSNRAVASGGAGGALAPPVFGRSVNPISTRRTCSILCMVACIPEGNSNPNMHCIFRLLFCIHSRHHS